MLKCTKDMLRAVGQHVLVQSSTFAITKSFPPRQQPEQTTNESEFFVYENKCYRQMKRQTKPDNFIQQLPLESTKNSDFPKG